MLKKINELWLWLIGTPDAFTLESRIFHSISVCLILLNAFYFPYNFFEGIYVASASGFIFGAIFLYQYYNSRFNDKPHSSLIFGLTGLIIFGGNYFATSGINGSTDVIWPAYLLLLLTISPYRQHLLWLCVYIIGFLVIHVIGYEHPEFITHPFTAGKGEFIDRVTAFPIPVITIYIIITYIRKSYDKEKLAVEEKAHQLEQSNAEKNKLMSIVSHDMRAPLINIQSYLELLNENELDSEQRPKFEKELLTATNSTMDMLSNLLQWSKSQMEGPSVSLAAINLLTAIKSTLDMGKKQAEKKGIAFNYAIEPGIMVMADINMLQLVIRNLISNAIKFTHGGGAININTQLLNNECKITVNDNGQGINPHQQQKIFFINTEPTFGTNNERGVGLGLLLCKEFIERQGGRIGFESTFGLGSSFFVFIPVS